MTNKNKISKITNVDNTDEALNTDGYVDCAKKLGTRKSGNTGFSLNLGDDSLFAALYTGNGLTKRYIDLLSDDMTRQWVTIPEDTDGIILNYLERLKAKKEFKNALRASKLFGGSIIFMVIDDGGEPNDPVNVNNIRSVQKLKFFSRKYVTIDTLNYYTDAASPKFGDPEFFTVTSGSQVLTIHESRCLVFRGEYYPFDELGLQTNYETYWGLSILQSIHEELEDYGLAQQALMRLLTKANIDVLKIKGLMGLLSTPDGLKQLDARITSFDLAKSVSTTLLLDNEENFDSVNQTLTGVAETFTKSQTALFGVMGVPPMLFGIQGKSLGGNDDNQLRLYYDRIKSDQDEEMLDPFDKLKGYIVKAKDSKVNENQEYNIKFNSLWQQTENEKVTMRKEQAETDQIYINNGVVGPEEVRESRFGGGTYSIETEAEGEVDLGEIPQEPKAKENE
jgi:hypothetical protein